MNITGDNVGQLVNILPAQDYLFGTQDFDSASQQGGIYNRNIVREEKEKIQPFLLTSISKDFCSHRRMAR